MLVVFIKNIKYCNNSFKPLRLSCHLNITPTFGVKHTKKNDERTKVFITKKEVT